MLQKDFRVTAISGDSSHKTFFACAVKESDVVICTAQILQNALASGEEDTRVELTGGCGTPSAALPMAGLGWDRPGRAPRRGSPRSPPSPGADFSLLVIDECHHTHKEAVYNKIMLNYLQRKLSGQQDLPQVLGLTASPGTGGATTFEGAVEHILQVGPAPRPVPRQGATAVGTASPGV